MCERIMFIRDVISTCVLYCRQVSLYSLAFAASPLWADTAPITLHNIQRTKRANISLAERAAATADCWVQKFKAVTKHSSHTNHRRSVMFWVFALSHAYKVCLYDSLAALQHIYIVSCLFNFCLLRWYFCRCVIISAVLVCIRVGY